MSKYIIITMLPILLAVSAEAQVIVKWDEISKEWFINSAGYPAEEPSLDSLYFRLHDFKLSLNADGSYQMIFSKDSVETGKYESDKKKRELILTADKSGKKLAYSVAELTPHILTLTIGKKYSWAYYISLTPYH
ncbi:MAG TPA: hypothetical protein VK766_08455 [Cytophagaceae bacterium]|jgi:hypothetical protein|nr:hypothetical protein [Cytophagaceae bacterium]